MAKNEKKTEQVTEEVVAQTEATESTADTTVTNTPEPKTEKKKEEKKETPKPKKPTEKNVFQGEIVKFVAVNGNTVKLVPGMAYPKLVVDTFPHLFG